jgi:hypothetical protein
VSAFGALPAEPKRRTLKDGLADGGCGGSTISSIIARIFVLLIVEFIDSKVMTGFVVKILRYK